MPARLDHLEDGTKRIHLSDGEVIDLPNISGFDELTILGDAIRIEGLKSLVNLEALENLEGSVQFKLLEEIEIGGEDLETFVLNSVKSGEELSEEILEKFPESVLEVIDSTDGTKQFRILKNGNIKEFGFPDLEGEPFVLPDTITDLHVEFLTDDDSLAQALRQIERTERQLSKLAEDESLTYDLENAMRDLESARKSLRAAEERLEQQK